MSNPILNLVWCILTFSFCVGGIVGMVLLTVPTRYPNHEPGEPDTTHCYKYAMWTLTFSGVLACGAIFLDPIALIEVVALTGFGIVTLCTSKWRNRETPT